MDSMNQIVLKFPEVGEVESIKPLTSGLINQTYLVRTADKAAADYILQCINHNIFTDVEMLQHNIEAVTAHIRKKLEAAGEDDIDRKVLRFAKTAEGKTYYFDGEKYWRMCVFIPGSQTLDAVTPESSYLVGLKFGEFEAMLADLPEKLGETIPDFHNMEFRMKQLREAVAADKAGRMEKVGGLVADIEKDADEMCCAERLYREGKLPKRICHCDTKVSNMLFDDKGNVLCVIDLDTVMPSFVFSDFGDFLRSAANTAQEDEPDLTKVNFSLELFEAYTKGFLEIAGDALTPLEIETLPWGAKLMTLECGMRFLADFLQGDVYFKTTYPEHNLVRARTQFRLVKEMEEQFDQMQEIVETF